jgi:uncharacterized protein
VIAVFADTGYWVALINRADSLHNKASSLSKSLCRARVVTTGLVLVEILDFFAEDGPKWRRAAATLVNDIKRNANVSVVDGTPGLFWEAFTLYENRSDKGWSLGDCASFIVMEQYSLTEALAHDIHFVQAGFRALLRE